jgi:hypothetical protein
MPIRHRRAQRARRARADGSAQLVRQEIDHVPGGGSSTLVGAVLADDLIVASVVNASNAGA